MPFDYEANITAIKNALVAYNTTTANPDLSSGLTTRVQNVYINDPETVNIRADEFPAIFIRTISKQEDFGSIGAPGPTGVKKNANVIYEVIGLYQKDGFHTSHEAALTEIYRLAENIEGVFQAEHRLSATALWVNPARTEFFTGFVREGVFVKGVSVELAARYLFR